MMFKCAQTGPYAAIIFAATLIGLPLLLPDYSSVHQTVSEIGEVGSPVQLPFTLCLCAVALCVAVFAWELRDASRQYVKSSIGAYLVACMAVSTAGVGIFSFPHPLHNVFGPSEIIGYQAPLVLAWTWRGDPRTGGIAKFSWIMGALVWLAILANCATFDHDGALWAFEKPFYGLVQRALFVPWFVWAAGVGMMLASARRRPI
jgi:hypothetical membrane protein